MALSRISENMVTIFGNEFTESVNDPAVDTNPATGVGTLWINTASGEMYCCTDATTNRNVWTNIGDGTGSLSAPTGVTNTGNFPASHIENSSYQFTFSGATDADGSVTHYLVDTISSDKLTVSSAEVAAGQAHTFNTGDVDAHVTGITFRVRAKDDSGLYSSGVTVTTSVLNNAVPTNVTNTGSFPASHTENSSYQFTFSGATDADGSVTHYKVESISSDKLTVSSAEVAAGSAHTFNTGAVDAEVTGITFVVKSKDNNGVYSSGVTVTTSITDTPLAAATGGDVIATDGNFKYHVFNNSGTFTVSVSDATFEYLVVAGGGGGGCGWGAGGGGGAGGYLAASSVSLNNASYTVTVGGPGARGMAGPYGGDGGNSVLSGSGLSTVTAIGGGGASSGGYWNPFLGPARNGGSGGGGGSYVAPTGNPGSGTPGQGHNGGQGSEWGDMGGGGGGSSQAGGGITSYPGYPPGYVAQGYGGDGTFNSIAGTAHGENGYYAGGGGGGNYDYYNIGTFAAGGNGGGGRGGDDPQSSLDGDPGQINTGGGGGGGAYNGSVHGDPGSAGGKGIVIIRYRYQ